MVRAFSLAFRYVAFHKWKTAIVVFCITLTFYLPAAMHLLVRRFEQQLAARAQATPLVIGAKGSRFDLALHGMYFDVEPPEQITMADYHAVRQTSLAAAFPLHARFRAGGFPIVGVTLDYFTFRQLQVAQGTQLVRLGDCVLGAAAARQLDLKPGDRLLSQPENLFDLAGAYPLKMRVVGVLAPSHSADDEAVFVDLKSAWIIEGIGHGHQDLVKKADKDVVLERTDSSITANAALVQYTEITDDNVDTFHFHGSPKNFPLTAVIAAPHDIKSETILLGKYVSPQSSTQALQPMQVVDELMEMVFRVQRFFHLAAVLLGVVTVLFLVLVTMLSLRLRRREMETMFKMGSSRWTIFQLQAAEMAIVLFAAAILGGVLSLTTLAAAPQLIQTWLALAI